MSRNRIIAPTNIAKISAETPTANIISGVIPFSRDEITGTALGVVEDCTVGKGVDCGDGVGDVGGVGDEVGGVGDGVGGVGDSVGGAVVEVQKKPSHSAVPSPRQRTLRIPIAGPKSTEA